MKEKYNYIIYKISDGVAEIKLNRTEVLNSLNYEMADELIKSFEDNFVEYSLSKLLYHITFKKFSWWIFL